MNAVHAANVTFITRRPGAALSAEMIALHRSPT
jgi:hypothetical protein